MKIKVEIDFGNIVCDSNTLQSILIEYLDCDEITVNVCSQRLLYTHCYMQYGRLLIGTLIRKIGRWVQECAIVSCQPQLLPLPIWESFYTMRRK
jgi:hypothetical protein